MYTILQDLQGITIVTISTVIRLNLNLNNLCSPPVDLIGCVIDLYSREGSPIQSYESCQIIPDSLNNLENILDYFVNRVVNLNGR